MRAQGILTFGLVAVLCCPAFSAGRRKRMTQQEILDIVLRQTKPLEFPRGDRLPLYLWVVRGLGTEDPAEAEAMMRKLDDRGIAVTAAWNPNPRHRERSLKQALSISRLQKKLGLRVNVDANRCTYSICNGDPKTAHVTDEGEKFFDMSMRPNRKIGCPFALEFRYPAIREQLEYFARAYKEEGIQVDFMFADWEIDGPIEWNDAWAASKRCKRCRDNMPQIDDFRSFQKTLRTIRCEIQREVYAEPMKPYFPNVLVGNYAVYPGNGYRYWYDYFERDDLAPGMPHQTDQGAKYREWFDEFPLCGYTFAMPVVYTWYRTFDWYDFDSLDYRWFYNLLLVTSNAGKCTAPNVPIITFVHWTTTAPPPEPDPNVKQFSGEKYKELLWHMLLRGHDGLFLWCPQPEAEQEIKPLHEVYAASLEYRGFLERGEPVSFDVPKKPGPVVSGLRLGDWVLARRTDFDSTSKPVEVKVGDGKIVVPRAEGRCQILRVR